MAYNRRCIVTGIRRTVQWYLDNEWWWKPIHEGRYSGQRLGKG